MTTCLEKSCSFGLLCLSVANVLASFPFEGGVCELIVLTLDHCLSIYLKVSSDGLMVL